MTDPTVLTNAWVVTRDAMFTGTVEFLDDHIVAVYRGSTALPGAIDLEEDYLLPGLIELHTDNLERYLRPRPSVNWPALNAVIAHDAETVAAGITSVFDALTLGEITEPDLPANGIHASINAVNDARRQKALRADHYLHLRCEVSCPDVTAHLAPCIGDAKVGLVSVMDHAPGQRQYADETKYREWYETKHGYTAGEVDLLIARHQQSSRDYGTTQREQIAEMCRNYLLPLASHDDATIEHVEQAVADGGIICEFPTTEIAARTAAEMGLKVLMGAPNLVRGESHSGNLAARTLAMSETLHILSSDYYPASLLQAVFTLHRSPIRWPLPDAVNVASAAPAEAVGLVDRGEIAPGKRADLIRVHDLGGMPVIRRVWASGQLVF